MTVSFEYEETRQENDLSFIHFGTPTKSTTVTVLTFEDIEIEVSFSHRKNDPTLNRVGTHTWQLHGTLLPLQAIRVAWHRRAAYERWVKSLN